ncbi:Vegetative incompatibility protein HET-E-1 [Grifola frondosa]|uniref:Vegetative incompatibility protein HET-E-1 n=1 Tax=Grifola frondosa TaxID=5627 RepID=A0A1C7MD76_GRIFR|nr:Vegetative incompatibility protein HET-E-1 [Grifola frondosa]
MDSQVICEVWNASSGALSQRFCLKVQDLATAFTPDGRSIVVVTPTNIQSIDAQTGGPSTIVTWSSPLPERGKPLIHFATDGRKVVLSRQDKTIYLWDGDSGKLRQILDTGEVQSVAFFPDGTRLVVADVNSCHILIWDVQLGKCLRVVDTSSGHAAAWGQIYCMTVSPLGDWLALGMGDGTISIIDCSHWDTLALVSCPRYINDLCFSPKGDRLVSSFSATIGIHIWDTAVMKETTYIESRLLDDYGWTGGVVFSPNSTQIATYSSHSQEGSAIDFWTISSGTCVHYLKQYDVLYDELPPELLFTNSEADGQLGIIIAREGQPVLLRDVTSWTLKASTPESYLCDDIHFFPDGKYLATAYSGTVTMWKTSDLSECWTVDLSSFGSVQDIRNSPESTDVLLVYCYDMTSREQSQCLLNFWSGDLLESTDVDEDIMPERRIMAWDHLDLYNGWIYSRKSRRRLFWLPPMLRPIYYWDGASCNNLFAIISNDHSLFTVLDLSSLIETSG